MNAAVAFSEPMPGISPDVYGVEDFRKVARIVYDHAGIVLPDGKAMLVYSRLAPLVRESGCGTFANYIELVRSDFAEESRAVAALTTNHTFFFRESHHFDHFAQEVRPGLIRALEAGQPVRIWSAGCSSGEETWSLVLTLLGEDRNQGRKLTQYDLRVLASDLAPHALKKASAGIYPISDASAIPDALRKNWLKETATTATISDEARSIVRFRKLNLLGEWPMAGRFDVIFCRNVMIYFDQQTKERLVSRFAEYVKPGQHLYIGHSERVTGPAAAHFLPVGPTIYRRSAA